MPDVGFRCPCMELERDDVGFRVAVARNGDSVRGGIIWNSNDRYADKYWLRRFGRGLEGECVRHIRYVDLA